MSENNARLSKDLYDVLMALRDNIGRNLKVATLAVVESIDDSGTYKTCKVNPFPLTEEESSGTQGITAINGLSSVSVGDIVAVLFLDRDPRTALRQTLKGVSVNTVTKEDETHIDSYGVIIADLTANWKTAGEGEEGE